jgi:hypothetical protein
MAPVVSVRRAVFILLEGVVVDGGLRCRDGCVFHWAGRSAMLGANPNFFA